MLVPPCQIQKVIKEGNDYRKIFLIVYGDSEKPKEFTKIDKTLKRVNAVLHGIDIFLVPCNMLDKLGDDMPSKYPDATLYKAGKGISVEFKAPFRYFTLLNQIKDIMENVSYTEVVPKEYEPNPFQPEKVKDIPTVQEPLSKNVHFNQVLEKKIFSSAVSKSAEDLMEVLQKSPIKDLQVILENKKFVVLPESIMGALLENLPYMDKNAQHWYAGAIRYLALYQYGVNSIGLCYDKNGYSYNCIFTYADDDTSKINVRFFDSQISKWIFTKKYLNNRELYLIDKGIVIL